MDPSAPRSAARANAEPPYLRDPTFPKVSTPPGPADVKTADSASARVEMGVRGGRVDARDETDALDAGRPCTREGVDVALGGGEVDCDSCRVGIETGDGAGGPKGLFDAKGLFDPNAVFCGKSSDGWEACNCTA